MPKKNLVGILIPVTGTPLSVEETLAWSCLIVGVGDGFFVGVIFSVGTGVGVDIVLVCPDGVAVKEGKSLSPAAKTVNDRLIFSTTPSLFI